jgi:hypothetical protein
MDQICGSLFQSNTLICTCPWSPHFPPNYFDDCGLSTCVARLQRVQSVESILIRVISSLRLAATGPDSMDPARLETVLSANPVPVPVRHGQPIPARCPAASLVSPPPRLPAPCNARRKPARPRLQTLTTHVPPLPARLTLRSLFVMPFARR